ncbi:MAG: SprT-like domain-containing protein [Treponema sp.]|nr:SprT-like domain-containing protein [Treponema sp.]
MITKIQYEIFDSFFKYYNEKLFDGKLKDCMIITNRQKRTTGHFRPQTWKNKKSKTEPDIHEISINPDFLDHEWQQTLVHEMVHLWQQDYGKPSRKGYHNSEWAQKMETIGLMPSSTGKPDGKKTGQKIADYPISNGLFMEAFNYLKGKNIKYISQTFIESAKTGTKNTSRSKIKYTCFCGNNVWGKPNLIVICAACNSQFIQAD